MPTHTKQPVKNNRERKQSILITQFTLVDYAGSEVITLELCEYFLAAGYDVTVFTNVFRKPIAREFMKRGVKVLTNSHDPSLTAENFDVVWVHHQVMPISLLESLENHSDYPHFIFHHMSPYEALETPFLRDLERALASDILANSYETADTLKKLLPGRRIRVFGNPAPARFFHHPPTDRKQAPEKILVVSNHVPGELPKALDRLLADGTTKLVDYIGVSAKHQLLTPEVLARYDLVVTIGKTVQYSLALGVPVYIYDRFGGPGFLTNKNFSNAFWYNFSGRGFEKAHSTSTRIYQDIKKNYADRAREFDALRQEYADLFSLDKNLTTVIKELSAERKTTLTGAQLWVAQQFVALLSREVRTRYSDHDYLMKLRAADKKALDGYVKEVDSYTKELEKNFADLQKLYDDHLSLIGDRTLTLLLRSRAVLKRLRSLSFRAK